MLVPSDLNNLKLEQNFHIEQAVIKALDEGQPAEIRISTIDQHYHIVANDGEDDHLDATPHEKCLSLCDIIAHQIGKTVRFTATGDLYRLRVVG